MVAVRIKEGQVPQVATSDLSALTPTFYGGLVARLSQKRPDCSEMLQELTHMDRITQLQDEIQNVCRLDCPPLPQSIQQIIFPQLLMIMANSINYLTTRADFRQVSPHVPITKQRNIDKFDPPDVFEGMSCLPLHSTSSIHPDVSAYA